MRAAAEREIVRQTGMQVIYRVIRRWRDTGMNVSPGASVQDLDRLGQLLGGPLTDDVREYFSSADGMADRNPDEHMVSWWSVERIFREMEDMDLTGYRIDPRDVPIADVLLDSWYVFLRRVSPTSIGVFVEGARLELPSLTEFFTRYETSPLSLGL